MYILYVQRIFKHFRGSNFFFFKDVYMNASPQLCVTYINHAGCLYSVYAGVQVFHVAPDCSSGSQL